VGNLNDYVKYQLGQGMEAGGSGGAGGMATELAVGLAIAQQVVQQQGGQLLNTQPPAPGSTAAAPTGLPDLMGPAEVAQILGVSESDVLAVIESGELKAKKIGSAYRIKRSAVDEFLAD
jgi:excisionase family DNA binding protein